MTNPHVPQQDRSCENRSCTDGAGAHAEGKERATPPGGRSRASGTPPECDDEDHRKAMALVALAANFGKELPEPLFALWLDLLAPHPGGTVEAAVKNVILHYEYKTLPPFAVLQKEIDELRGFGGKSLELRAKAEWVALMEDVGRRGSHNPPASLHPTTAYALRIMGGWLAACRWTESGLEFKRREFLAHWVDCHGNVNAMALGAAGLEAGTGPERPGMFTETGGMGAALPFPATVARRNGAVRVGAGLKAEGVCEYQHGRRL